MYEDYEIRQIPLSLKDNREKVEKFLSENGLRIDPLDYYAGVFAYREDEILGGGGLCGNVIKCLAVNEVLREDKMGLKLVTHLISVAVNNGYNSVKLFTKPENKYIFESLGFMVIAEAPKAILMEIGQGGVAAYCKYLSILKKDGRNGVIVMNAHPFTKGHLYLISQAAAKVEHLYIIMVKEEQSFFSYQERKAMVQEGCGMFDNVTVCDGSDYAVSSVTFPTYFLKELSDATDTQIALDLDIFIHYIAETLNACVRFVGSEPSDSLTRRYNELMHEMLPSKGIEVVEIERLVQEDHPVSASLLREYLVAGSLSKAVQLACRSTIPYLISYLATAALQKELDLTPKPGLVDKSDNGAHQDMNYTLMQCSIQSLRPYLTELSKIGFQEELPEAKTIIHLGQQAENAMFETTSGINTHKGALFSLGLVTVVASHLCYKNGCVEEKPLQEGIAYLARQIPPAKNTHGSETVKRYPVKGALENACNAYELLFSDWLPFLQQHLNDENGLYKTLLRIMQSLDDTNVCYRKGLTGLQQVKTEASDLLHDFSFSGLQQMNERFIRDNISPGGSADMLSLTIFIQSILS